MNTSDLRLTTPQRTRVKICGLRTREDVHTAIAAGADAIGFVTYPPSPRYVSPSDITALVQGIAPWVSPVVLFVNPSADVVKEVIQNVPQAVLQFHADEDNDFCAQFGRPFIKAARMQANTDLVKFEHAFPDAQALLVDAMVQGYGGAGHVFDWSWLPAPGALKKPLILSGGLDMANVGRAITELAPYAVDVSSGVESARGVKSPEKIQAFCRAVRMANAA